MSEVKVYTFDDICESQKFNNNHEFISKFDYEIISDKRDELLFCVKRNNFELAEKDAEIKKLREALILAKSIMTINSVYVQDLAHFNSVLKELGEK